MNWLLVILGIIANAAASALVKTAAPLKISLDLDLLTNNWRLITSVACYGVAFVAYSMAVQKLPLSIVHPVSTAGAIILVGLISGFFFNELFSTTKTLGYAFLVFGVILIFSSQGKA